MGCVLGICVAFVGFLCVCVIVWRICDVCVCGMCGVYLVFVACMSVGSVCGSGSVYVCYLCVVCVRCMCEVFVWYGSGECVVYEV